MGGGIYGSQGNVQMAFPVCSLINAFYPFAHSTIVKKAVVDLIRMRAHGQIDKTKEKQHSVGFFVKAHNGYCFMNIVRISNYYYRLF
jgi:hypothetical protein